MQLIILCTAAAEVASFPRKRSKRKHRNEAVLKISFFLINVDKSECICCRQLLLEPAGEGGVVEFSSLFVGLPDRALDFFRLWDT